MSEAIRQKYKFNSVQLRFQKHIGPEIPIHRHIYNAAELEYSAILGLKAVYDSVPRERLVEVLAKRLSKNTVKMVSTMLQEIKTLSSGDILKVGRTVEQGVYQGSLLRSTIFNV